MGSNLIIEIVKFIKLRMKKSVSFVPVLALQSGLIYVCQDDF